MGKTIHLVLALACAICFTTNLPAQDVGETKKPKAAKKSKGNRSFAKYFGAAELNKEQKTQLKSLVSEKKEALATIKTQLSELVSKDDAKSINVSMRKAMGEGAAKADALKTALSETSLSAEDQAKVVSLRKQREEIEKGIADQIMASFSEEQKVAMTSPMAKGAKGKKGKKGKGKKGKGSKKKGKKKDKEAEDLTSQ